MLRDGWDDVLIRSFDSPFHPAMQLCREFPERQQQLINHLGFLSMLRRKTKTSNNDRLEWSSAEYSVINIKWYVQPLGYPIRVNWFIHNIYIIHGRHTFMSESQRLHGLACKEVGMPPRQTPASGRNRTKNDDKPPIWQRSCIYTEQELLNSV